MERGDIILWRTRYLQEIKRYRSENRPIVYIDETWIDSNMTFAKCWQGKNTPGIYQSGNSSRRLIVLCAGGEMGFIPNSNLIYQANVSTGDYHGQMNAALFEKWTLEKLMPNLPENAVIIIDNAPYHSVQTNKISTFSCRKQILIDWLSTRNISVSDCLRKVELLSLVKQHAPRYKEYRFDTMLTERGFQVLRLPPYHCDINAIEYVWAEVKTYVRRFNVTGDISLTKLLELANSGINSISKQHWQNYCMHVKKLEEDYWEKDSLMEEMCELLVISISEDSTSSSSNETDSSSSNED